MFNVFVQIIKDCTNCTQTHLLIEVC